MKCPRCGSLKIKKAGSQNNIKRFYCKDCKKYFQENNKVHQSKNKLKNIVIESKIEKKQGEKEDIYVYTSNRLLEIANIEEKTPTDLMLLHGFDPLQWELVSVKNKEWNGTSKLQGVYTMYSSTIQVKPLQKDLSSEQISDFFYNLMPPKIKPIKHNRDKSGYAFELPIMDVHIGKLTWKDETGANYDLKIAENLYKKTILDLISRIPVNIDLIYFPIGQDFFHIDNDKNSTNKGTTQDVEGRWPKIYNIGCNVTIWAIEQLRRVAPVEICYVRGNHDTLWSYFLIKFVEAWFRKTNDVKIDVSPRPRKVYQWGECFIGYTHGEESKKQLDKLFQAEFAEQWGKTKFREVHAGHLHSEHLTEYPGFKFRRISSITSTDNWHNDQGYKCTIRQAQAFIWHKEKGLQDIINSVIES